MRVARIFPCIAAILLSACGTEAILTLASSVPESSLIIADNAQAIASVPQKPLVVNDRVAAIIDLSDAAMAFDGVYGNFELFSFHSESKSPYKIELRSVCECTGIQKHLMYPIAYVMNAEGEVVNDTPVSIEQKQASRKLAARILAVWEGEIEADQTLYFVVAADNKNPGENVGDAHSIMMPPTFSVISLSLLSYPEGEILVDLIMDDS